MIATVIGTRPYFLYDAAALLGGMLLIVSMTGLGVATMNRAYAPAIYLGCLAAGAAVLSLVVVLKADGLAVFSLTWPVCRPSGAGGSWLKPSR